MSKTLNIRGFRGMNNVQKSTSFLVGENGMATPKTILNLDVAQDMSLVKRDGQTKKIVLSNARSLWAGSVMLCVSDGKLCKLSGNQVTEICDVGDISDELSYVEINGLIYISNVGVYNPNTGLMRDWGVSLPCTPTASVVSGEMPPGRYCVCYTKIGDDGQISGSGPIIEIEWSGDAAGIELLNFNSDYLAWITDTNGTDFFLATVESNKIVNPHYDKPLPSLLCSPPPKMSHIAYAFGRMWGISGNNVYYSEPSGYEWWKATNCFIFNEELVMIAPVATGIFIASRNTTWVLTGTSPEEMAMSIVGEGAVPGTLVYDEFQQSGHEIMYWQHQSSLPTWISRRGFVIGNEHLQIANLTDARLDIEHGVSGAALSRKTNEINQVLITMPVSASTDISDVFEIGKIFIPEPVNVIGSGGINII